MTGEKLSAIEDTAEQNLIELLALEAPQAERIIRRLACGDINREQAQLEMHELLGTIAITTKH